MEPPRLTDSMKAIGKQLQPQTKPEVKSLPPRSTGLELREGILDNVPHVIIGSKEPKPQRPEDPLVSKLRKYALIFFTVVILGTAAFFILKEIFGRFF